MGKVRTTTVVFELPQRLGILQYVEYEPPRREWCTKDGCPYEGVLTAEGCKKGVCLRYRVWVFSKDGRQWKPGERLRKRREEEGGGRCLRQQVADALMELAERSFAIEVNSECGIAINGVAVSRPHCRSVDECVKQMLEEYRRKLEGPPPPRRNPEEEEYEALLQQHLWLRWWSRDMVLDALRHDRRTLQSLLHRLNEVPHFVAGFLGRFDLDLRCIIDIYRSINGYCISFCVKDFDPRTYCYEPDRGWYATPQPKFLRLKPLEDGKLTEIYTVGG
jgi:hypothetical protein